MIVALTANNIRALVKQANELNIKRENILSILKEGDQYVMIYNN